MFSVFFTLKKQKNIKTGGAKAAAGKRAPEDTYQQKPITPEAQANAEANLDRWLRMTSNDLENIPFGLIIIFASLFILASHGVIGGAVTVHIFFAALFTLCRYLHTLTYAFKVSQKEERTLLLLFVLFCLLLEKITALTNKCSCHIHEHWFFCLDRFHFWFWWFKRSSSPQHKTIVSRIKSNFIFVLLKQCSLLLTMMMMKKKLFLLFLDLFLQQITFCDAKPMATAKVVNCFDPWFDFWFLILLLEDLLLAVNMLTYEIDQQILYIDQ